MISFIKIPEIQLDIKKISTKVLNTPESEWKKLEWGQSILVNRDYLQIKGMFRPKIKVYSTIMVMRFNPNTGLPIHKDNERKAVIQIPLYNCESTPTFFYDEDRNLTYTLDWKENSAYMFDTHVYHNLLNDTEEPRYMLYIPFFHQDYKTLLDLYTNNDFFYMQDAFLRF